MLHSSDLFEICRNYTRILVKYGPKIDSTVTNFTYYAQHKIYDTEQICEDNRNIRGIQIS